MKQLKFILILMLGLLLANMAHAAQRNLTVAQTHQEQKRVALVIGNAAYQATSPLRNPVNDARAMSQALNALGFQVIEVTNATQHEMNQAIDQFGRKLNADTAALFFYAGHGLQVKGKNYLVPVDAEIAGEASVRARTVDVDTVMDQLSISPVSIVILDACRNNPFERSFRKMGGGLAQMDAPKGSFVAYATAPGKTAADGDGKNGLFTQELLKQINVQGLTLESVFKRVRAKVSQATGDEQMPWDSSSMTGDFYFKPATGTQVASLEPVPVPSGSSLSLDDLKKQQSARRQWDKWQQGMKADFEKVASLNAAPDLQFTAWDRFLNSYSQDNPYSTDDESLRADAQSRKQSAEAMQQQAASKLEQQKQEAERQRQQSQAAANGPQPGKVIKDCPDCPEMVVIPAGSFEMGSNNGEADEKPVHHVTLRSFALGKTEVTQGQWKALMGNNPSAFKQCGDNCPVEQVSWDDAQAYIQKLNAKTGNRYRLPSEAEWEYACRAGGKYKYCGSDNVDSVGWYGAYATPVGNSAKTTNRVATKQANAFGLYDMSGNVWEWVEDSYHDNYNGSPTDGSAWSGDGAKRVLRGGSWVDRPQVARSAVRIRSDTAVRNFNFGFRLARMLP